MSGLATGLDELEELIQARATQIEILMQAARQSQDAQTLAQLDTCLQAGTLLQQQLSHMRNHLSGELHQLNQLAQTLNQNVPDHVSGDPSQPGVQALELHG